MGFKNYRSDHPVNGDSNKPISNKRELYQGNKQRIRPVMVNNRVQGDATSYG